MAISMLKIRRPLGRLIFNMGIAIPGKTVFLIETAPRVIKKFPNKDIATWLLIRLEHNRQQIRIPIRKSSLSNFDWNVGFPKHSMTANLYRDFVT